tara:strand:+ start:817 stop:1071 length:255 start_codon:yes stop_codon:yes gene_type:complete
MCFGSALVSAIGGYNIDPYMGYAWSKAHILKLTWTNSKEWLALDGSSLAVALSDYFGKVRLKEFLLTPPQTILQNGMGMHRHFS